MSLGYPAPELKWYKDDMEIDRYCGLPKYEIRRNGKTHTLHIYKYVNNFARISYYHNNNVHNFRNAAFYCLLHVLTLS